MLKQVRRWLPSRAIVVVADSSFATFEFLRALSQMSHPVHVVTRLRLDAQLFQPAPARRAKQMGRPRKVGKSLASLKSRLDDPKTPWQSTTMSDWYGQRNYELHITSATAVWYKTGFPAVPIRWVLIRDLQGKLAPQALLIPNPTHITLKQNRALTRSAGTHQIQIGGHQIGFGITTDLKARPEQILQWFRQRWQVEVTFEEVRAHLGVETQRQWSSKASLRTTPALLALFSMVTVVAHQYQQRYPFPITKAAWYQKSLPVKAFALALVRQRLWHSQPFQTSDSGTDMVKVSRALFNTWANLLCLMDKVELRKPFVSCLTVIFVTTTRGRVLGLRVNTQICVATAHRRVC
ncbi:MAG: transposase [Cyanobacteria bacterium P01_D01_bin.56]